MFTKNASRAALAAWLLAAASFSAQAHPGHGAAGLAAGLAHPFMGLDHLLAMLAVGLWSAAALPAGRRMLGPAVFLAALLIGALSALGGLVLPMVEPGIALSVVLLALLMLGAGRLPIGAGLCLVAGAALLHGHAHGSEWVEGPSFAAYAAGFMGGSALLHGIGLAAGARIRRLHSWAWRALAALIGGSGLVLLAAQL